MSQGKPEMQLSVSQSSEAFIPIKSNGSELVIEDQFANIELEEDSFSSSSNKRKRKSCNVRHSKSSSNFGLKQKLA